MRVISADSYFRIGKSHLVCQDYASHLVHKGRAQAHLADGCSTAFSPYLAGPGPRQVYTDIGARLLVIAAQRRLAPGDATDWISYPYLAHLEDTLTLTEHFHEELRLDVNAFSATLSTLYLNSDQLSIHAFVSGDGWVVGRRHDSSYRVIQIEYPSGAPYYPRYSLESEDYNRYLMQFGPDYIVRFWDWHGSDSLGAPEAVSSRSLAPASQWTPPLHADPFIFPLANYDLVLAFSDGLASFGTVETTATSRQTVSVPVEQPLAAIVTSLKGMRGEFLKRNLLGPNGAWKTFQTQGWEHHDDLSVIGVYASEDKP